MTRQSLMLIAAAGSVALLGGAFISQYVFGLPPCEMCLWQRWPHAGAILVGLVALVMPSRLLAVLGGALLLTTAAIGVYHVGVEQGIFEGITECTSSEGISGLDVGDLLDPTKEVGPPLVRCDQATYIGPISMAAWNALLSFGLAGLWFLAAGRPARA